MRQHQIPQFYLRAFVDPDSTARPKPFEPYLHVFNIEKGLWHRKSPANIATAVDYYDDPYEKDLATRRTIERVLGIVEDRGARAIEGATLGFPGDDHRKDLALFMSVLYARNPRFHDMMKEEFERRGQEAIRSEFEDLANRPEELKRMVQLAAAELGVDVSHLEPNAMRQFLKTSKLRYEHHYIIAECLASADMITQAFLGLGWRFLTTTPNNPFIASDNPVAFDIGFPIRPMFGGFGFPGLQVSVPLTRELAILATNSINTDSRREATDREVKAINLRTATQSLRHFYAPSRDFSGSEFYPPKSTDILKAGEASPDRLHQAMHLPRR